MFLIMTEKENPYIATIVTLFNLYLTVMTLVIIVVQQMVLIMNTKEQLDIANLTAKRIFNMKKIVRLYLLLFLLLTGCSSTQATDDTEKEQELMAQADQIIADASQTIVAEDNTQDIYHYTKRISLYHESLENEFKCPTHAFVSSNGVSVYQQFFNQETKSVRNVFYRSNFDDSDLMQCIGIEECPEIQNYYFIGAIWNSNNYISVVEVEENDHYQYIFYILDENLQKIQELPIHAFDGELSYSIDSIIMDSSENIHMIIRQLAPFEDGTSVLYETSQYYIFSKEGKQLVSWANPNLSELCVVYDDQVAYSCIINYFDETAETPYINKMCNSLGIIDPETGNRKDLVEIPYYNEQDEMDAFSEITMMDEENVCYADTNGFYKVNIQTDEKTLLYQWKDHGMKISGIYHMDTDTNGISLLLEESNTPIYLHMEPVTEKKDLVTIDLVVSATNKPKYNKMVTEFHKQFPNYHINIISGMDETALKTALIAGEGPVLIDTEVTGFEDLEKLWLPLDSYIPQLVNSDDIYMEALEYGKINGTLYGLVDNFRIHTVAVLDSDIQHWNYESFLLYLEKHPDVKVPVNYSEETSFVMEFFIQGLQDNYFVDPNNTGNYLQKEHLNQVLDLADAYYPQSESIYWGESLMDGETFCNWLLMANPESFAMHRIVYGSDLKYVGFPCNTGNGIYLEGASPLCIRKSATDEEKILALAFMKYLLSKECQSKASESHDFWFSIRKDICHEQFYTLSSQELTYIPGQEQFEIGDFLDPNADYAIFQQLVSTANAKKYFPTELSDIFFYELLSYENGTISRDTLLNHLESRVNLYMSERE